MEEGDRRISVTLGSPALTKASFGGGVAREDCWSEAATSVLIDAWGERYLALGRGNLRQTHWREVADIVNSSMEMGGRSLKTDMQCKNRIDTVKKKFKLEKSKMVSRWCFFQKLQHLIGLGAKTPAPLAARPLPKLHKSQKREQDSYSSETEPQDSHESTDTYPLNLAKKQRADNFNTTVTSYKGKRSLNADERVKKQGMSSVGELTKAVLNLGEVYEQAENAKLRQVMEIEKQRMKFTKDLELQRMQLFMKTQLEISQMKEAAINSYGNNRNNHLRRQFDRSGSNKHVDNNITNLTLL